jgi:hypothetical protein
MATQIFSSGSYNYIVIDDSAAPSFPTLNCGTHIGYDTTWPGTITQGSNPQANGTIPDFLNVATSIATGLVLVNLKYKNPS